MGRARPERRVIHSDDNSGRVEIKTRRYLEQQQMEGTGGRQVFVGNLPFTTTWQDLKDSFKEYGPVVRAEILETPDGKSKGAGTVLFENAASAQKCIRVLHNATFDGRVITVRLDKFANE